MRLAKSEHLDRSNDWKIKTLLTARISVEITHVRSARIQVETANGCTEIWSTFSDLQISNYEEKQDFGAQTRLFWPLQD